MTKGKQLTARTVATATKPGLHGDGGGLWLQLGATGGKSWAFRFQLNGRARQMGLGPVDLVSLAEARDLARDARRLLLRGVDPIEDRRANRKAARVANAKAITFRSCAKRFIASHEAGWRNEKHRKQWSSSLEAYLYPTIGDLPVSAIDTGLVMQVLEPIWTIKPETAGRVRGRIEAVLSWAAVRGYRNGDNPARWRGHLDQLLPARRKVRRVKHHAAMPYAELPAFMVELRGQPGTAARALEFTILTVGRTGEVLGTQRPELDMGVRLWTVPPERMKGGRLHRVPLSQPAVTLLEALPREATSPYVFPGARRGRPLSNMAMTMLLERMGRNDATVHGFRSSFRDWAAEVAHAPREVAEAALAHAVGSEVEAAYQRGDMLDRRRELMNSWAEFLGRVT
jgi:integrase